MSDKPFHFKQFVIEQDQCAMKVGTDGVLLGAWCHSESAKTILDIGTGTGIIAIMQAQRNPNAVIDAVEIDIKAAKQANANFKNCPWAYRLHIYHNSLQQFVEFMGKKYDVIICNPPFYSTKKYISANSRERSIARNDILLNYSDLLKGVDQIMHADSLFSVIIPYSELEQLMNIAISLGLFLSRKTMVYPKENKIAHRVLLEFTKQESPLNVEYLIIQKEKRNDFEEEYKQLTKGFYTIL